MLKSLNFIEVKLSNHANIPSLSAFRYISGAVVQYVKTPPLPILAYTSIAELRSEIMVPIQERALTDHVIVTICDNSPRVRSNNTLLKSI